jgi:hypothetical protein
VLLQTLKRWRCASKLQHADEDLDSITFHQIFYTSLKLTDDLLLLGSLWLFRLFLRVSHDVPGGGKVLKHAEPMFLLLPCNFVKFLLNMARCVRIKRTVTRISDWCIKNDAMNSSLIGQFTLVQGVYGAKIMQNDFID